MEIACQEIRNSLKQQCTRGRFDESLTRRLKSLRFSLLRIQNIAILPSWINELKKSFEEFIDVLSTNPSIPEVMRHIKEQEKTVIYFMTLNLKIPLNFQASLLESSLGSTDEPLEIVFPKFLLNYMSSNLQAIPDQLNFSILVNHLRDLFTALNVPFNYFVKSVARKCMGDPQSSDWAIRVDIAKLETFFRLFFGCSQDYKFYVKIAKIYSETICPINPEECREPIYSNKELSITPTSLRKLYNGCKQTFSIGANIPITGYGVPYKDNFRADGLAIFGKHNEADIIFPPDEKEIDYVNFIIFFKGNTPYGIDCSSKKFYCGIKLLSNKNIEVKVGMMLNLAKTSTFYIGKKQHDVKDQFYIENSSKTFEYEEEKEMKVNAKLTICCFDAPFAGDEIVFDTISKDSGQLKSRHMIGSGTGGEAPDFYIPNAYGISRNHITFIYENKLWYMNDNNSSNGSYLLFKDLQEYERHLHSKPVKIFSEWSGDSQAVLLLNNYVFLVSSIS